MTLRKRLYIDLLLLRFFFGLGLLVIVGIFLLSFTIPDKFIYKLISFVFFDSLPILGIILLLSYTKKFKKEFEIFSEATKRFGNNLIMLKLSEDDYLFIFEDNNQYYFSIYHNGKFSEPEKIVNIDILPYSFEAKGKGFIDADKGKMEINTKQIQTKAKLVINNKEFLVYTPVALKDAIEIFIEKFFNKIKLQSM